MPNCCVYGCKEKGGHTFPKEPKLRKLWLHAVRRKDWVPTKTSVVCQVHFDAADFLQEGFYSGLALIRRKLKSGAIPTVFEWCNKANQNIQNARKKRLEVRTAATPEKAWEEPVNLIDIGLAHEEIIDTIEISLDAKPAVDLPRDASCQTVTEGPRFSINAFVNNPKAIHFYTGLENYSKFSLVLNSLGPAAYQLNYYKSQVLNMSVENQFFLTLIKLRLNKQVFELGLLFEVSEASVSNIFNTWIPFMAFQWGEIDIWPNRDLVNYYMPHDFKRKFPDTRVIMDGTEFPIGKPKEPNAQQVTFSTYKNRNTLKVLVGVTPGGLISYCSDAYGGSASDRQIVERSKFINMCSRGDNIMADRGFNVQDLFAPKDIHINIPSFLKGKSQLPGLTVVHDRKIASKRVHVERIIGLTKTYKMLKHELNPNFVHLGTQIYFVCAMLCNFREGIVGKNA